MHITNNTGISLSLAVWLIDDNYDYIDQENYISVTTLMRPVKQIVLAGRVDKATQATDVSEFTARALGNAIHAAVEKAWVNSYQRSLRLLGTPQSVIDRVRINPSDEEMIQGETDGLDLIAIYLEQREYRQINGYTIGGKFDLVAEGHVEDTKSTSAYGWLFGTRDDENRLQGSLYRWIDVPRKVRRITKDYIRVNYVFTDWQKAQARQNPNYPQKRTEHKDIPLLSLQETENFIITKLDQIERYKNAPEHEMPECTDEELWRSEPQYKYYSDPTKTDGRSTRNFDNLLEANTFMSEKGKGIVITKLGEVKRCAYCPAFDACKQKDRYHDQP